MIRAHSVAPPLDARRIANLLRPWHPSGSDEVEHYTAIGPRERRRALSRLGNHHTGPEPAVAIVVVARRHRIGLARKLRRAGLQPIASVLLVPGWPRSEHLLTIGAPLPDGVERHLGGNRTMSMLGRLATRAWLRWIIALLAPSVGTIATTATTAGTWFAPTIPGPIDLHVSARPRRDAPTQLALAYRHGATSPMNAVKYAADATGIERLEAERRGLIDIGRHAEVTGVAVPHVVGGGADHLIMSALAGRPLDRLVRDRPTHVEQLAGPVLTILERWQRATATPRRLIDAPTIAPTEQLAAVTSAHPGLAAYAAAVETLMVATSSESTLMVARHGDLTAANVLRSDADGTIGFLDWESARSGSLPTTDDWYFVADAIATSQSCSHADAVEQLVRSIDGPARSLVERIVRTQSSLALSADVATLAFHATWIDHAFDDVVRGTSAERFVAVLRRLHDLAASDGVTVIRSP